LLYRNKAAIPSRANETRIAQATMKMLGSLGICTVPAYIGGRGPVEMLVDTGAAHTLLTWKGVADLDLSRDSPQLSRIPIPTGAMGSDNVAIELSHRLFVSSSIQIGDRNLPGLSLAGARLSIDIGQIPVIDGMPGVGGILGADALMRCDVARISCREPFEIALFKS
jgi:Aspartyl protease